MSRLPRLTGKALLAALKQAGFEETYVRGNHYYLRKQDSTRLVVVPVHSNSIVPPGTLKSILRQAELTAEELIEFIR
jgi:predicted RNA binding protein YcfA (HicA-like mRNA interferase family)